MFVGFRHSDKTKKLLSEKGLGRIVSKETRKKISNGNKGKIGYWRGKHLSEETKKKMSKSRIGRCCSKETRLKIGLANSISKLGIKLSEEHRIKISNSNKGEKSYLWEGGKTPINSKIRNSIEFRLWREAVFARDNWTCQKTGIRGGILHSHHIKNFSQYSELRLAIDNGITLSKEAHKEFHKIYSRKNNTIEQLDEFLNK